MISLNNVSCGYGQKKILNDINLTFNKAQVTCLLGRNGVGKTTLFKTILGLIPALSGKIMYGDKERHQLSPKDAAKFISYVPQAHGTPFPFSVFDVVLMGQYVHSENMFGKPSKQNQEIAMQNLEVLGIKHLKDKRYAKISGGEKQMALIARALAQQPSFIAMDEPTANLDMGNQFTVLQVAQMLKNKGYGIIINTHSPEHALNYADEVVLLNNGRMLANGKPEIIIQSTNISALYNSNIEIAKAYSTNGTCRTVCIYN